MPQNLERLIARSLSTPRNVRMDMRRRIVTSPTRPLSYLVLVDNLADRMISAYAMGYRANGASLRRESRTARHAHYRRMARQVLQQYQTSTNAELQRIYQQARAKGVSSDSAAKLILRRFGTLGHTAPVSNRLKTLYGSALRSAYNQGLFDSTSTDAAIWGFRWIAREVRGAKHPTTRETHWQFHRVTLPKEHDFWRTYWVPLEWNCKCRIKVFRRKQTIQRPPPNPMAIDSGFRGQSFELQ